MIKTAIDVQSQIHELYRTGMRPGVRLGLPTLDEHYSVRKGNTTIITAYPTAGKSFLVFNILCALSVNHNQKSLIFSPEMGNAEEIYSLIIEILTGLRMSKTSQNSVPERYIAEIIPWISENFIVFDPEETPTMKEVLDQVRQAKKDRKISNFVIDNYNDLKHSDPRAIDMYTEKQIVDFNKCAKETQTHGFMLAHPRNLMSGELAKIPRPDEIKGGSAWWSKGQTIIGIHRDEDDLKMMMWKIKPRHVGKRGEFTIKIDFDRSTYYERIYNQNEYLFKQAE